MSLTLRELADSYKTFQDMLSNQDIDFDTVKTALDGLEDAFQVKASNIAKILKAMQTDSQIIEEELFRLNKVKNSIINNHDRLKKYLEMEMTKAGIAKVERLTPLDYEIALQDNNPSVEVDPEVIISKKYWRTVPAKKELDRKKMLEALKNGVRIKGAKLKQTKSLRIR